MLLEVLDDVVALVERRLAVGVDEVRDLVGAGVLAFLVGPFVRDVAALAARQPGVVGDVGDAEVGELLADFRAVRTAL